MNEKNCFSRKFPNALRLAGLQVDVDDVDGECEAAHKALRNGSHLNRFLLGPAKHCHREGTANGLQISADEHLRKAAQIADEAGQHVVGGQL